MQNQDEQNNDDIFRQLELISKERYSATVINNTQYDFFEKFHNNLAIVKIDRTLPLQCYLKDPDADFKHFQITKEATSQLVQYLEDLIRNTLITYEYVSNAEEIQSIIDRARMRQNPDEFYQFHLDVSGFWNSTFGAFETIAHPKSFVKTGFNGFCCLFGDKYDKYAYELQKKKDWKKSLSNRQEIYRHFLRDLIIIWSIL